MKKQPINIQLAPHEVYPVLEALSIALQSEVFSKEHQEPVRWFAQRLMKEFFMMKSNKN